MGSVPFLAWAHLLPTIAHPPESDAANPLQIRWFSSLSKIRSCCQPHNWNLSLGVFGEWLWILMDECPSLTTNWAIMRDVKFLMQKHSGCVASDALLRASYSNGAWDLVGLFSLSSVFTNTSSDLGHIRFWERKGALCVCVILLSGKKMRIVAMLEAKKRKASTFGGDERYDPDAWKCFLFALPEYSEELKNDLSEYRRFWYHRI